MAGKHAKKPTRRRFVPALIIGIVIILVAAGAAALWFGGVLTPSTAAPVNTTPTDSTPTTTTAPTTTAPTTAPVEPDPPPDSAPQEAVFARPEEMRGAWMTAGVDYATAGRTGEAACKADIDAALTTLAQWKWNTVLLPLTEEQITKADSFDAPAYILKQAREKGLYVYMVLDCGVAVKDGRDPTLLSDRLRVTYLAARAAQRYDADGFLLTGYAYLYGDRDASQEHAALAIRQMLTDAVARIKAADPNNYVGLLAEPVWAHASVLEGGSDTANVYEEFTDGGADTRALVSDGVVDFVMIKAFRATGDHSASFSTVLKWWSAVCKAADTPLYVAHAATRVGGKNGWMEDQLARQILACKDNKEWQGSTFDSMAALTQNEASTGALQKAFDGTLLEEYITRRLTLTSPSAEKTTTNESAIILRGSADPNFPLLLNGEEVTLTEHGYFTLDRTLTPGDNVFTFENKGMTSTYTITYNVAIIKSVSPAKNLTLDGGAAITVSAVAHRDATVYATIGGTRVDMTAVTVQEDEGDGGENSADYVTYSGRYTLPAGMAGQARELGAVTVSGTYASQTAKKTGGTITVKALPVVVEPQTKPVKLPALTPIDPAGEGKALAKGTVLIVTADYAETFSGDTTDDYSRPTNAYLPMGTTDILAGTAYDAASGHQYYLLGCGRRVYVEDAEEYITNGSLSANTLGDAAMSVAADNTTLTLSANWRVPYQLQLLPQAYASPQKQDYTTAAQTTEYIEITFYYTTAVGVAPDVTQSPLFSRAEWKKGEGNTYKLRLYLTKKAQFYGYHTQWDNKGNLTFTFRHPTYVGGNDPEQPLKGFKVVIDPGHGGNSIGTAGGAVAEKTLTLTYSLLLRDKLQAMGATVVMTRTADTALSLLERTQITRPSDADLFISIHMNGSVRSSSRGCTVHYFSDYSRGVAETLYEQMQGVYTTYGNERRGGERWDPFYVCRVSEMPALLLECGYMTNAADLELLVTPAFQDDLTTAMAKGVVEYAQSLPKL